MHVTLTAKRPADTAVGHTHPARAGAGDQLSVTVIDAETIVLKRRVGRPISALCGLLPKPAKALTVQEMEAGVSACLVGKQAGK